MGAKIGESFTNYRNAEHRHWNATIFSGDFDPENPRFHFFGITEFTIYHYSMGFMSGFFKRDVEKELHTCLSDMSEFGDGMKLIKDFVEQLKENPGGMLSNWQLMQEAWNFGYDLTHNDDMRDFGACTGFVNEFREAFEWLMRHLNPAVWIAGLPMNIITHCVGLVRAIPRLLTDFAIWDMYKMGYDIGNIFQMLFA